MRLNFLLLLLGLVAGLFDQAALAQVSAPSEGGEINIERITATSIELSFGTTGTGQGRVVAIAKVPRIMSVMLAPIDGQFYKASPIYAKGDILGEGYAIYNGDGHSMTVTGLQPNSSYYIADLEYNTDGISIAYNTYGISAILTTNSATNAAPTPVPLPVELTSFTGTVNAQSLATLRWTTASERNTDYFALERSPDGTSFKEVGRIAAAGTNSRVSAYQWPDPQRLTGTTYYRLRQVDIDGTFHYSSVITLAPISSTARLVEVYPNPSAGQAINILLQGYDGETLTLRLSDSIGRSVLVQTLAPVAERYVAPLTLPAGLAVGTYVLTLAGSNSPMQKRIIVSN
jgi:hypothetical protein